ncbi:MAG: hypothetical protein ACK4I8_11665, partial [Armatimonadota bacterium]
HQNRPPVQQAEKERKSEEAKPKETLHHTKQLVRQGFVEREVFDGDDTKITERFRATKFHLQTSWQV